MTDAHRAKNRLAAGDFHRGDLMQGALRARWIDVPCGRCTACAPRRSSSTSSPTRSTALAIPEDCFFPPLLPRGHVLLATTNGALPDAGDNQCSIYEPVRGLRTYEAGLSRGRVVDDYETRRLIARRFTVGSSASPEPIAPERPGEAATFLRERAGLSGRRRTANATQLAVLSIEIHDISLRTRNLPTTSRPDRRVRVEITRADGLFTIVPYR